MTYQEKGLGEAGTHGKHDESETPMVAGPLMLFN
jgi:hypothetical protein